MLADITTTDGLAQAKALIRFYFGATPATFEEVAHDWGQLDFCLRFEGKIKDIEMPVKK